MSRKPLVSIGLPVYNGAMYLRQAIDSILAQTFVDFELVICDNASTDETEEICLDYARRDPRVRYHRNETNIGGSRNHNRVFELSRGEYFAWAGHDDVRAPTFLERTVRVLDADPAIVLCFSTTCWIDASGRVIAIRPFGPRADSSDPVERFRELIRMDHNLDPCYGLIRSDVLRQTRLEGQYADSDRVLLAELALHGRFFQIREELLFRRDHPLRSTKLYPSRHERTAWFEPGGADKLVFPHPRQFWEYLRAIHRSPLGWRERGRCYLAMFDWFRQNRRRITSDLSFGVKWFLRPLARGWQRIFSRRVP